MAASDGVLFRRDIEGIFLGLADGKTFFDNWNARTHGASFNDAATAGTAVTGTPIFKVQGPQLVKEVALTLPVSVTASATDRFTITVSKSLNGGALTTIATATSNLTANGGTGNIAALAPIVIPLSTVAGATALADGELVSFAVTKQGSGVAMTAATSSARVEVEFSPL